MKKTRNNKKKLKKPKFNNLLNILLPKLTRKNKKSTRNKGKKKSKAKKELKSKAKKNLKSKLNTRKRNKMMMKGGAIPFSELNPSLIFDRVKDNLSGHLSDKALMVPNNLASTSSVVDHPHLDAAPEVGLGVAGKSSLYHFASE